MKLKILFFFALIPCFLSVTAMDNTHSSLKPGVILTLETEINGIRLKDILDNKAAPKENTCRVTFLISLRTVQNSKLFVTQGPTIVPTASQLKHCDTQAYKDQYNKRKELHTHLVNQTAILCPKVTFDTKQKEWIHAIILGSSNPLDCNSLIRK